MATGFAGNCYAFSTTFVSGSVPCTLQPGASGTTRSVRERRSLPLATSSSSSPSSIPPAPRASTASCAAHAPAACPTPDRARGSTRFAAATSPAAACSQSSTTAFCTFSACATSVSATTAIVPSLCKARTVSHRTDEEEFPGRGARPSTADVRPVLNDRVPAAGCESPDAHNAPDGSCVPGVTNTLLTQTPGDR
jgi:hypothetical protein